MAHLTAISQYNSLMNSGVSLLIGAGVTDSMISYDTESNMAMECFLMSTGVAGVTPKTFDFTSNTDLLNGLICLIDTTIARK